MSSETPPDETPPLSDAEGELVWVKNHLDHTDADQAVLGRRRVRLLQQMRRPLPLSEKERADTRVIELRPFNSGADDEGFLRVNNRAFAWHPDQGGWGIERLHAQTEAAGFDPKMLLIHQDQSGAIDGFCWTKIHPATDTDPALGEIYVIAVDPDTYGTGLGRALTVGGLNLLSMCGVSLGMLSVEADNQAAISLYERLGFEVHHRESAYRLVDSSP